MKNITYNGSTALLLTFLNYHGYSGEDADYQDTQVILEDNGNITINYDYIEPSTPQDSATLGIENIDGTDGLEVSYNTAGVLTDNMTIQYIRPTVVPLGAPSVVSPGLMQTGVPHDGTLEWIFGPGTVTYDLWFGPAGAMTEVVTGAAGTGGTIGTYSYTGLNPQSDYEWQVIVYDGGTGQLAGPVWSFTSACAVFTTFPWVENIISTTLPACWADAATNADPWSIGTATSSSNTGPQSGDHTDGTGNFLYTEASGNLNQEFKLSTPLFNTSALTSPVFEFWYHMYGQTMGTLQVNILETDTGTLHADVIQPISGDQGDVWSSISIDLTSYTGNFLVEFVATTGTSYYSDICLDDIAIFDNTTAPACSLVPNPVDMAVDLLETGTLMWSGAQGATDYKISLGTDNPPTNIVDMMDVGAALSYDYAGLTYGTTYYWSVTPYNTNGDAVGCPVWSFTTRANPIISAYPYSEDFETGAMPLNWVDTANPDAWSYGTSTSSVETGPQSGDHTSGSGYFMYTEASSNFNQVFTIQTNPYDVSSLAAPTLEFWYHMYGQTMGTLQVNVIDNVTGTVTPDVIQPISGDQGDAWFNITVDLTPFNSNPFMVQFVGTTGSDFYSDICIDDLAIYDNNVAPTCTTLQYPQDAETGILNSGRFGWAGTQGATGYKVFFGTDNPPTNIENGTDLGASFYYDFSGLSYSTTYYWSIVPYNTIGDASGCPVWSFTSRADPTVSTFPYVMAFEDTTLLADWHNEMYADNDDWVLATSTGYGADADNTSGSGNFINFDDNGTGIDSAWATSTIYDITALTNPTLELQYWIGDPAQATQEQSTLYMDIYSNGTWNNAVQTYTYSPAWTLAALDLTPYSASDLQFRFRAVGSSSFYSDISVDDFTIFDNNIAPSCTVVNSPLDGEDPVMENGTMSWRGAPGATGYKIYFGTDNPPTNIENGTDLTTALAYDYSGLSFATTYYWTVVPYNTLGDAQGCPVWSFVTRADPTISTFPWTEDFSVWPLESSGWSLDGTRQWAEHAGSGSAYCNFWSWNRPNNAELYSPPIALSGDADLLFKWSHSYNTSYPLDSLKVYVSTDQQNWVNVWERGGDQFESNDGAGNTSPGTFVQETISINQFSGQTIYLKFDAISGYGPDLYLDDVGIKHHYSTR